MATVAKVPVIRCGLSRIAGETLTRLILKNKYTMVMKKYENKS